MPETLATRAGKCTPKERKFARELVKTGVQRTAALNSYDTTSPHVADKIAQENLQKTRVKEEIDRITKSVDLKDINEDTWRLAIVDSAFGAKADGIKLKGREAGAKIWGLLDERPVMFQNVQLANINTDSAGTKELATGLTQRLKLAGKVIDTRQVTNSPSSS